MSLTADDKHDFPLDVASQWTANYRKAHPKAIQAHAFGKHAIKDLLKQEGCIGLRIYYALDDAGVQQLIVVGVDENTDDMYEGMILERSKPCPPICGHKKSPLAV